jgi:ABC-type phosphate transport system auxiliary subunit
MAITARLSSKLRQTLGDEAAEDLVNWMQQVDAQRAELRELNELNFARVDARFAEAREAMRADLAELRQVMQADRSDLREAMKAGFAELRQEMSQLETRLERRIGDLIKWSFVFWVGAVGAIAALAGVLR